MVATHGWKLLPQVSNKNRLEIAFFIRRLLDNADSPIYWLTTERTEGSFEPASRQRFVYSKIALFDELVTNLRRAAK